MRPFLTRYLLLTGIGLFLLPLPVFSPAIDWVCQALAHVTFYLARFLSFPILIENNDILRYHADGFAIVVSHACAGLSSMWLLGAAILVFPAPWKAKTFGIFSGFLIIQVLNILRLMSLVYFGQFYAEWFETVHEQLWPLLFNFISLVGFALWFSYTPSAHAST